MYLNIFKRYLKSLFVCTSQNCRENLKITISAVKAKSANEYCLFTERKERPIEMVAFRQTYSANFVTKITFVIQPQLLLVVRIKHVILQMILMECSHIALTGQRFYIATVVRGHIGKCWCGWLNILHKRSGWLDWLILQDVSSYWVI